MRKSIFTVIFLATVLFLSSIPNTLASTELPENETEFSRPILEDELLVHWMKDENDNKIDDAIEHMSPDKRIGIMIDYHHHPSDEDIKTLAEFDLTIRFIYAVFNTISAENVVVSDVEKIAKLDGVKEITFDGELPAILDVSSRAIKARESVTYTPHTVADLGFFGSGITIAVLDTGADDGVGFTTLGGHDSLNDMDDDDQTLDDPKFVCGNDFTRSVIYNGSDINPNDEAGHGTHCSGIALGTGDGAGDGEYRGIAPQAYLADVKVMRNYGAGTVSTITRGIDFCIQYKDEFNIRVLSMSIGGPDSNGNTQVSRKVNEAAFEHGLVVVGGMGNDGQNKVPNIAAADGAIAVGSINDHNTVDRSDDTASGFSNTGPRHNGTVDINDLKPDVLAPGELIFSAMRDSKGTYVQQSGTSMSTPHVAGVVALMLEANPNLSPQRVKEILRETAYMPPSIEPSYPEIDPVYNVKWGWGIVDAYEAVRVAQLEDDNPPEISDIQVVDVSTNTATIEWLTNKPANSIIHYGSTPDLGLVEDDLDNYMNTHSMTLEGLSPNTDYYYNIQGYDQYGHGPGESGIQEPFHTDSTPDTTPPDIIDGPMLLGSPGDTSATIYWMTNEVSDSLVGYGQDTGYGSEAGSPVDEIEHFITLIDLIPDTEYHYYVESTDPSGNTRTSGDYTFQTASEPDLEPPEITSGPDAIDITDSSATIVWKTEYEASTSLVRYGETTYYGNTSSDDKYVLDHSIKLTGLNPATIYYYQIESEDSSGNTQTLGDSSRYFTTGGSKDKTPPEITDGPKVTILTDESATIEWTTNEKSDSWVDYGSTTSYGFNVSSDEYVLVHNFTLINLTPSSKYHYRVISKDSSLNANVNTSQDYSFMTKPPVDKKPPKILTGPSVWTMGESTATIVWTTDEGSDSVLHYGLSSNYDKTESDSSIVISHQILLSDLTPSTTYHYKIVSTDEWGNSVESDDNTFTTLELTIPIEIEFLNLDSGQTVSGIFTIEGRISGGAGNIEQVRYKIDDGAWQNLGSGDTFNIVLDTTELSEGEHSLTVEVKVGEMTMQDDITFVVEQTSEDDDEYLLWALILVIILVIVLGTAIMIKNVNRKRKAAPLATSYIEDSSVSETPFAIMDSQPLDTMDIGFIPDEESLSPYETQDEISFIPETMTLSEEPEVSFVPDREPISFDVIEDEPIPFSAMDTVRCPRCRSMFESDISSAIVCPECGFSASLKK
ncbi:MAG: S8 family serine peptidase [Methanomassiliicoccales archaeon]|nr:MAG: S8 family serine peptidase [Methanomassiliicoccales archaeon]